MAPHFVGQLEDSKDRSGTVYVKDLASHKIVPMSERSSLEALHSFLTRAHGILYDDPDPRGAALAEGIGIFEERMAYIGQPEFTEAVREIATHWQSLFEAGTHLYLYVPKASNGLKSREYVALNVIDEVEALMVEGSNEKDIFDQLHIVTQTEDLIQVVQDDDGKRLSFVDQAEDKRVILLDDWMVSGNQVSDILEDLGYEFILGEVDVQKLLPYIEIHLLAQGEKPTVVMHTTGKNLRDGVVTSVTGDIYRHAYYVARSIPFESVEALHRGLTITGSHSSVDFGYITFLLAISGYLEGNKPAGLIPARVMRSYGGLITSPELAQQAKEYERRWSEKVDRYK